MKESAYEGKPYSMIGKMTRRYSWTVVIALVSVAVVLFIAGFAALAFGLSEEMREKLTDYAQYLGGAGTVLASVQAYWTEIRRKYLLIRLQRANNHVLVCGLGEKGKRLVEQHRLAGSTVAVIESSKDHPEITGCWERGVVVITGDAADRAILDMANAACARLVYAVTSNDNTNIEISRQLKRMVVDDKERGDVSGRARCFSHVKDGSLKAVFMQHEAFARTYAGFDARIFNIYEESARFLLEKYSPDMVRQGTDSRLRILVAGFGACGERIVRQASRVGHYADGRILEIKVVDRNLKKAEKTFLSAYGDGEHFIVDDISLSFTDMDPHHLSSQGQAGFDAGTQPDAIYVAMENDTDTFSVAMHLRHIFDNVSIPIIICLESEISRAAKKGEFQFMSVLNIIPFNVIDFACAAPVLLDEVTDSIARAIHQAYVDSQRGIANASVVEWDDLPENLKDSNRWQADHLMVKLRAMGYSEESGIGTLDRCTGNEEIMVMLSELEHRRWNAALFMDGWKYAPGKKDPVRKTHPSLVPYEALSAAEKSKDDTMIVNIRNLVASPAWKRYAEHIRNS